MRPWLASALSLALIASCSARSGGPSAGSTGAVSATTPAPGAVWPLRGTAAPDAASVKRRPIVVKVANDVNSRPQTGLLQADLVIEIPVEGNITRLAVVYQSQEPSRVGPVRSARQSDLNYLSTLKPILTHVGASDLVAKLVRDASNSGAFVDVDEFEHPDAFERTSDKPAPYNTYTSGEKIRQAAGDKGKQSVDVPPLPFDGAVKGPPTDGRSLTVPYPDAAQLVTYAFDDAGGYRRTQGGQATTDGGKEVHPQNVVILVTDVKEIPGTADAAGSPSVDYRGTGTGPLVVLRDGKRFVGTWSRQGTEMYKLADASGAPISLMPGLTWLHIVPSSFDIR